MVCKTFPISSINGKKALEKAPTFAPRFREAVHPAHQHRQHLHHDRQFNKHPAAAQPPRLASLAQGRGPLPAGLRPAPPLCGPGPAPAPALAPAPCPGAPRSCLPAGAVHTAVLKSQSEAGRGAQESCCRSGSVSRPRAL